MSMPRADAVEEWLARLAKEHPGVPQPPPGVPLQLNVGCGHDVRPASDGWINADGYASDPRVLPLDLVETPWPFPDNAFANVLASHVMEHVPVLFRPHKTTRGTVQRDVLYAIMEEYLRVLEPGGRLEIRVPEGGTPFGHIHPQHYRQWRPDWFRSLADPGAWDAEIHHARFKVESVKFHHFGVRLGHLYPIGKDRRGILNWLCLKFPPARLVLGKKDEIRGILVAIK